MIERFDVVYAKEANGKTYWNKVGAAFINKSGNGYNLVLEAIPVPIDGSYKLYLFEPRKEDNKTSRPQAHRFEEIDDDIPFA